MTPQPESRRPLGWFDITCLGLNCVIGVGIFSTPGFIAQQLGPYAPLAFLVGALLCILIGLCFAEMASRYPGTGGAYLYAREAFGPRAGFCVGWVVWLSGLIGGASVAVGLATNVAKLGGWPQATAPIAAAVIATLGCINYLGARGGAWSNNLLALLKLGPLFILALWGLFRTPLAELLHPPAPAGSLDWRGFLLVLYTFSGFEEISLPAGEVKNARRNVPLAILLALVLVAVLYFLLQGTVSALGLAGDDAPLIAAATSWPLLREALTVGALVSFASINAAIAFTCPRSLWALAADGWLPGALRHLHPVFGTPGRCILICVTLTTVLATTGTFVHLMRLSVLVSLLQYIATVLAVLRLGRGRLPLAIPLLALAVCVLLLVTSDWKDIVGMLVALAIGIVFSLHRGR